MSDKLPVPEIVLASASPRRHLLLKNIGFPHRIIIPMVDESIADGGECAAIALANAKAKAESVIPLAGGSPVLGADTVVDVDGHHLGKPVDPIDAMRLLKRLSGRGHYVHTGIFFIDPATSLEYGAIETTLVRFRTLGEAEIEAYVATGEPLDKAGAYGIQERGAMLVESIEGCFFNVMGLPVARLWEIIRQWMKDTGRDMKGW